MKVQYYLIALFAWTISSCEPVEFPELEPEVPVFFAKGTIDGQPVHWRAGDEGYFMRTKIVRSAVTNYYEGILGRENCPDLCPNSLRLRIIGDAKTTNSDNLFSLGSREFRTTLERDRINLSLSDESSYDGTTRVGQNWHIDGTNTDSVDSLLVIPKKQVRLTYTAIFGNKYTLKLSKLVKPTVGRVAMPQVQIQNNQTTMAINIIDENISSVLWSNGMRGQEIKLQSKEHVSISAKITYKSGEEVDFDLAHDNQNANLANFKVIIKPILVVTRIIEAGNPEQINTVLVEYVNAQGEVFTSENSEQGQSTLVIERTSPFKLDAEGNKTRLIGFALKCRLYNSMLNKTLVIEEMEGTFAIPHE